MRRIKLGVPIFLTAFIISCYNSRPAISLQKNDLLTEAEVNKFINDYDLVWSKRDTNTMKEIMHEDYTYFSSTGSTSTRSGSINVFTPADKYKVDTTHRDELEIKLFGNTAIVSSHWVGKGTYKNERFNDNQRCGLVIQKLNNKIRIISEHCTQLIKLTILQ